MIKKDFKICLVFCILILNFLYLQPYACAEWDAQGYYIDSQRTFRIKPPENWEIKEEDNIVIFSAPELPNVYFYIISEIVYEENLSESQVFSKSFQDDFITGIKGSSPRLTKIISVTPTTVAGVWGLDLEGVGKSLDNVRIKLKAITFIKKYRNYYSIFLYKNYDENLWDKFVTKFEESLNTLETLK